MFSHARTITGALPVVSSSSRPHHTLQPDLLPNYCYVSTPLNKNTPPILGPRLLFQLSHPQGAPPSALCLAAFCGSHRGVTLEPSQNPSPLLCCLLPLWSQPPLRSSSRQVSDELFQMHQTHVPNKDNTTGAAATKQLLRIG